MAQTPKGSGRWPNSLRPRLRLLCRLWRWIQSNRYTEHGTFRASATVACTLYRKAVTDVLMDKLAEDEAINRTVVAGSIDRDNG